MLSVITGGVVLGHVPPDSPSLPPVPGGQRVPVVDDDPLALRALMGQVGTRLRASVREYDLAARLGGATSSRCSS